MIKKFNTLEVLNICTWYKQARENEKKPLNDLPLKAQWNLKKNIAALTPIAENFFSLQQESEEQLRSAYISDEKSYVDTDENGQEIRKVKDEYLDDFQKEVNDLNNKLNDILNEENEFDLAIIDVDKIIDEIGDKETELSVDDLEILSLMAEEKRVD